MSNWILVGPLVGIVLITGGLILGIIIFPPIVKEKIAEVNNHLINKSTTYKNDFATAKMK